MKFGRHLLFRTSVTTPISDSQHTRSSHDEDSAIFLHSCLIERSGLGPRGGACVRGFVGFQRRRSSGGGFLHHGGGSSGGSSGGGFLHHGGGSSGGSSGGGFLHHGSGGGSSGGGFLHQRRRRLQRRRVPAPRRRRLQRRWIDGRIAAPRQWRRLQRRILLTSLGYRHWLGGTDGNSVQDIGDDTKSNSQYTRSTHDEDSAVFLHSCLIELSGLGPWGRACVRGFVGFQRRRVPSPRVVAGPASVDQSADWCTTSNSSWGCTIRGTAPFDRSADCCTTAVAAAPAADPTDIPRLPSLARRNGWNLPVGARRPTHAGEEEGRDLPGSS